MKPNIFMSYSRREVPFVNSLVADLENDGFDVWLDFRSLVPGSPWDVQINAAIDKTDVVLIIVSKASVESDYVRAEVERVFTLNKRVVLAFFESTTLPDDLRKYEWVDFRTSYKKGLHQLKSLLASSPKEAPPMPADKFKAPSMVWFAFGVSLLTALLALPALWTIWLPLMLIPLPYRILKRDFNFNQVQAALLLLPFALYFTNVAVSDAVWVYTRGLEWVSVVPALILFFVLRTPALQRWGKPVATMVRFANPIDPDISEPTPTPFCMDHASEDAKVANEIAQVLARYGHKQVFTVEQADVVLVLVSRFNCDTEADPEKQIVYPVILQTTDQKISKSLQRIQWIDFRHGVRNLEALAELLPQPERLLKSLALRPMGRQLIVPLPVMFTMYFWAALAMFNAGACLPYVIQFSDELLDGTGALSTLLVVFACLALFGAIVNFAIRQLVQRKKVLASWWGMLAVTLSLGAILYLQLDLVNLFESMLYINWADDFRGISARQPIELYIYGNIALGIYLLFSWKDMKRWFPSFNKPAK